MPYDSDCQISVLFTFNLSPSEPPLQYSNEPKMTHSTDKVFVCLTEDVLDLQSAFDFINLNDCGGNSIFIGTTR